LEMDIWTHRHLAMMRVGGNAACKQFFDTYGISEYSLSKKFSSDVAGAYRAKIIALVEARPWTDPTPEELNKYRQSNSLLSSSVPPKAATPPRADNTSTRTPIRSSAGTSVSHNSPNNTPTPPTNPVYQRYGNATSLSSNDYYGGSSSGGYHGSGYQDSSYRSKGSIDLDKITNAIQEEGQKGLSLAVKYFNKARLYTGNGYDNLDRGNNFVSAGGSQYTSGDRFYRINDYQPTRWQQTPTNQADPVMPNTNAKKQPTPKKPLPKNNTSPPVQLPTDEGGWDLSGWNDSWEEPVQSSTEKPPEPDNSLPGIDIWDFGTRPVKNPNEVMISSNNGKIQTEEKEISRSSEETSFDSNQSGNNLASEISPHLRPQEQVV